MTATKIETEKWNEIILGLTKRGWIITAKYWGFDAGIDHDFLILRKGFKKIIFGWDNWFEGEIKCNQELMNYIESEFDVKLNYGEPVNLKPSIILLSRFQSLPFWLLKKLNYLKDLS